MKRIGIVLALIVILSASCNKENNTEIIEQEQDLRLSTQDFINLDWNFDATGDSLKDQIIGLWLSNEVSYKDTVCNNCDSLFIWVFESTGTMTKRNNSWKESQSGTWEIDTEAKHIYYSYKDYQVGGTGYRIATDTINIEKRFERSLWTSHFIDYPSSTKMDIKFDKLK
jgi:hypothetical protein